MAQAGASVCKEKPSIDSWGMRTQERASEVSGHFL